MCPHEPEGKCGHTNQIMTAHVTCMTGPMKLYEICAYIFNFVKSHDIILCNTSSTPKSHFLQMWKICWAKLPHFLLFSRIP